MVRDIIKIQLYANKGYALEDGFIQNIYIYDNEEILYAIQKMPMIGLTPLQRLYPNHLDHLKCFVLNNIISFQISMPVFERKVSLKGNFNFYVETPKNDDSLRLFDNFYDLYIHVSDVTFLEEKEIQTSSKNNTEEFSIIKKIGFKHGPISIESRNSFGGSSEVKLPHLFIWSRQVSRTKEKYEEQSLEISKMKDISYISSPFEQEVQRTLNEYRKNAIQTF